MKLSDFDPEVPVISKVYGPGTKLTMSIELKVNRPTARSNIPIEFPPTAFASTILQRSVLEPAVIAHA